MTIRKAIDLLVAWGLVVRRHGREKRSPAVLIFEIMPAPPAIASQLRIQINEQIYFSRRVRFVEGNR